MRTVRDYVMMQYRWVGHRKQPDPSHEQSGADEAALHDSHGVNTSGRADVLLAAARSTQPLAPSKQPSAADLTESIAQGCCYRDVVHAA